MLGGLRPAVGPFPVMISRLSGCDDRLGDAATGLPPGPAAAEAIAVRLRRTGVAFEYEPDGHTSGTRRELVDTCRARGRHAVDVWRADPGLLAELQIGSWFAGGWRTRLVRRAAMLGAAAVSRLPARVATDVAFWLGVRDRATPAEWRRLTASYVVLCYHRTSGLGLPGQERWDVAPAALDRQLRLLRRLRWTPLDQLEQRRFHDGTGPALPRRRYVVTADDGFRDAIDAFTANVACKPQIFAVTAAVGGAAEWFDDVPVADWDELRRLESAGGVVGSHARHHVKLAELDDPAIDDEVAGSWRELRAELPKAVPVLAYPHGSHDLRVHDAAVHAGYALAYTTQQGRNGAGTDQWCLRRVEPKIWDTGLSFLWRVVTGESPPPRWEQRLERRWRATHMSGRSVPG